MKKVTLTATLVGVAMACLAAISSLSGKWVGSVKLPDGNTYPVTYELQVNGTPLTGTATAERSPKPICDGKIDGDNFVS